MYPGKELKHLATVRERKLRVIAVQRTGFCEVIDRFLHPVVILDRAMWYWRRVLPYAILSFLPVELLARRIKPSRLKAARIILRYGLLVVSLIGSRASARRRIN
jgi:hypothetical protein